HPLASRAIKTIPYTPDPPHEITIQKLAGRHFQKADQEFDFAAQDYMKRMGGAEFRKQLEEATKGKTPDEVREVTRDPVHNYDKHVVVFFGLKSWTYEDSPVPDQKDEDARKTFVDDLDPDALEFIAREILRWTRPSLFKEEAKAAQKETDGPSPISER